MKIVFSAYNSVYNKLIYFPVIYNVNDKNDEGK